jgi:HEPN domain-containing protein
MPHDPWRVADTRAWLVKAANDLRAADVEFRATPPLLEDIVFHAQQAAEKALKAFLTWHETPFRKTHSLEEIGEQCITIDANLSSLIDRAVPLTEYAWKFRYPGEPESPTEEKAADALRVARDVYETTVGRLPQETTRPNSR